MLNPRLLVIGWLIFVGVCLPGALAADELQESGSIRYRLDLISPLPTKVDNNEFVPPPRPLTLLELGFGRITWEPSFLRSFGEARRGRASSERQS